MHTKLLRLLISLSMMCLPITALAHTGEGSVNGLVDGILHPLMGIDHLLVMLAVGLWSMLRGGKVWWLPACFLVMMTMGACLNFIGFVWLSADYAVAFSVLFSGLLILINPQLTNRLASVLIAIFALLHGYVHAGELPMGIQAIDYSIGFLFSTGLLHLLGMAIGFLGLYRWQTINTSFGWLCTFVGGALVALNSI